MQQLIAIFGSAAHLALVAAAPLFLLPFCTSSAIASVLFALLPLALLWMLMEPTVRSGEMPHDARRRVARDIRYDAFVWIGLLVVAYAAFRAVNGGVSYSYNPERAEWILTSPHWAYLPGSADGAGMFPLAVLAALGLVVLATRDSLGRRGIAAFLLLFPFLSGIAGIVWLLVRSKTGLTMPDGTAFGVALVMSVAAVEGIFDEKWAFALPFLVVAQTGNLVGLVAFAPCVSALSFSGLWLVLSLWTLLRLRGRSVFYGGIAFPLVLGTSLLSTAILLMTIAAPLLDARIAGISSGEIFPKGYFPLRAVLSDCAKSAWLSSPWTGSGAGTFALDLRTHLTAEAWAIVPRDTTTAFNGWWQFLAEGGIVCATFGALAFGYLLLNWWKASSAVSHGHAFPGDPLSWAGPLTALTLAGLAFFSAKALDVGVASMAAVFVAASARRMESMARRAYG